MGRCRFARIVRTEIVNRRRGALRIAIHHEQLELSVSRGCGQDSRQHGENWAHDHGLPTVMEGAPMVSEGAEGVAAEPDLRVARMAAAAPPPASAAAAIHFPRPCAACADATPLFASATY